MRRLVLCVIVLIAIFAIIRSYTEQAPAAGAPQRAVELSPGLIEVAEGKGAANPVASNATEDGRALNRRTDIKVVLNAQ